MKSSLSRTFWEVLNHPTLTDFEYSYDGLINTDFKFEKPDVLGVFQTVSMIIWFTVQYFIELYEEWIHLVLEYPSLKWGLSFITVDPYKPITIKHVAYLYNGDADTQLFKSLSKIVHYCYDADIKKLSLYYESDLKWKDADLVFSLLKYLIQNEFGQYENYKIQVNAAGVELEYSNVMTDEPGKMVINLNYDADDVDMFLMDQLPNKDLKLPVVNNSEVKKRAYLVKSYSIGDLNRLVINVDEERGEILGAKHNQLLPSIFQQNDVLEDVIEY